MFCPYCGKNDAIFEFNDVTAMYKVKPDFDENGEIEYGDSEILYDSCDPHDYPFWCKHCNKYWHFDKKPDEIHYYLLPE